MENLIVTDSNEGFAESFVKTATNLFLLNDQVPLLLPYLQKQMFQSATVHITESAVEKLMNSTGTNVIIEFEYLFI